jgi:hypothetical protein
MFFLTVGRPALRLASSSAGTEVMGFLHMFGDARMPIWGFSAILSNILAGRLKQERAALVLFRIAPNADSVRDQLSSLVKIDQSDSNRSGKKRRKPQQWSRATGLVG